MELFSPLYNFISPVSGKLQSIDMFPDLQENFVWIGDNKNRPFPKNIADVVGLPALSQGKIWIGDQNNKAIETKTINLNNLPPLYTITIEGLPTPAPQIYTGTSSGVPEVSNAFGEALADILALNGRFLLGEFVMGDALVQATYPKSQFLINLEDGILKKTGKIMQHAVSGTDYVDCANGINPIAEIIPIWSANNQKLLTNSNIQVLNLENIRGVNSLGCVALQASNVVTSDQTMIARTSMQARQLILYDYNDLHRYTRFSSFTGADNVNIDIVMKMPDSLNINQSDYVLSITNVQTLIDQQGLPYMKGQLTFVPQQAPLDATYIIKTQNNKLTNAQVISELGSGMAKIVAGGAFAIAIADEDYATKATLEQIKAETEAFKNEAATSAEEAVASATEAVGSATEANASALEATGAAAEATGAAATASGAATTAAGSATAAGISALAAAGSAISAWSSSSSASSSASDASGSASNAGASATQAKNYLNTLLNTGITLQGDIIGSGNLTNPITTSFIANPTFSGKNFMQIPVGSTSERPMNPKVGMMRCNSDTAQFEICLDGLSFTVIQ